MSEHSCVNRKNATEGIAAVLEFWFAPDCRPFWFQKSEKFDAQVHRALGPWHEAAAAGHLEAWRDNVDGCLALCILLDQAPRNMFRGSPRAYASDGAARAAASHAVAQGFDLALSDKDRRMFFYLPFEHSEDRADQDHSVALMRDRIDDPDYLRYAERHREIIARFGRFPHRNAMLGRVSTPEESAFLSEPDSSF